jgi:hypothetical protein
MVAENVHMNACLILTVTEAELFESPDLTLLDYLWGLIKSEFYKRNVDTRDELLAGIMMLLSA